MAAADYYTQVYTMFVGYYGRPPAQSGLEYYAGLVDKAGGSLAVVIDDFFKSGESQAFFAGKTVEQQVNQIFQNLFGRDAAPAGLNYWANLINSGGVALSQAAYTIAFNAAAADAAVRDAKVASAKAWVAGLDTTAEILAFGNETGRAAGRDFLKTVTTSTPATQAATDAALKAMVDKGVGGTGATFTLTSGADQADTTGSSKNGGLITSDFKFTSGNELVTAVAGTFAATDVLADGSTTDADVFNITDTGGAAIAASVSNIETINIDVKTANGGLNMASVTGAKSVNVTANAAAQLTNVATATAPTIGLSGSSVLTVGVNSLAGTTAAGTAEALSVKFNGATATATGVAGLTLNSTTAGALETLNIESAGSVKNTVNVVLTPVQVTGITKTVVTGAADLELRGTAAVYNNMTLDAATHTGALTIRADFEGAGALTGLNAEKFTGVDGYVAVDLDGGGASADAFGLYNIANGSTVRIADDFLRAATNSIITVAGASASTADSVTVNLQNRAATANDVDLTGLTINSVESITVNSTYAPTTGAAAAQQNSLGNLTAGALQNLTIKGDSNLEVTLTAGSILATNGSNITVDASTLTGKLTFVAGNILDTTATGRVVTIKGGTNDDVITGATTVAVKNTFDLTAGGKDTVNLNVGDTNDSVVSFTNGDKLALGANAGAFVNGLSSAEITAAEQAAIEAAVDLAAAATAAAGAVTVYAADTAVLFSYQGNQYILMDDATFGAYNAATDSIVKVTGLSSTTTFDAGTFLFA